MDRDIWIRIVAILRRLDRRIPRTGRRPLHPDILIVQMFLWSVCFSRPQSWACDRSSYGMCFRPRRLPSASQFCRRLRTERVLDLLQGLQDELTRLGGPPMFTCIDGKALPVGECTRDPDARRGRGSGKFSRGYKLHAACAHDGRILVWHVTPLNEGEQPVAERLIDHLRPHGLVLADGNYDSSKLFDRVERCGGHLLTPLKGFAKSANRLRGMAPSRQRAIAQWESAPKACRWIYGHRGTVERSFANLVNSGDGIIGLPSYVRTLRRVRRFVGAKIILYNARLADLHAPRLGALVQ